MKKIENIRLKTNLRRLLERRSLSLHQVSKMVNINKSSLHNYLNGVVPQGLVALIKLANFFEVSLEELIFQNINIKQKVIKKGHGRKEVGLNVEALTEQRLSDVDQDYSLGELMKMHRKAMDLTQRDVARSLKVHPMFISKIESGHCGLPLKHLQKVIEVYKITVEKVVKAYVVEELTRIKGELNTDDENLSCIYVGIPSEEGLSLHKIRL